MVLYSSERATAASNEALWFLAILTAVAFLASAYVLSVSWSLPARNHFKLLLHCIMIITSVVPPELPITMSLTVNTAVTHLFRKMLYCTEPFRIPAAGKLTVCCFDKTGTLTTSEVILEQVIQSKNDQPVSRSGQEGEKLTKETDLVMGICHSIVAVPKKNKLPLAMRNGMKPDSSADIAVVGDPLERVAVEASDWVPILGKPDEFKRRDDGLTSAIILRR